MNREQVSQILQEHRSELAQKYGVRSLFLFGSVARNEANSASDVDNSIGRLDISAYLRCKTTSSFF
jgi:predicted nucleotidyltransferase